MSAIESGIYRKPDPACPECKGAGVCRYVTAGSLGRTHEVTSVRCACTDAPESIEWPDGSRATLHRGGEKLRGQRDK